MSNKLHHILHSTTCLSEEMKLNYINKKLSSKENHIIEKHLLDCESCTDEIEGMTLIKNNESTPKIIASINKRIDTYSDTHKLKSRIRTIAAILLLLIISSTFMLYNFSGDSKIQLADQINSKPLNKIELKPKPQEKPVICPHCDPLSKNKFIKRENFQTHIKVEHLGFW